MLHEILEGVCAYLNGVDSTRQKPLPEKLAEVVSAVLTQTVGMVADAAAAKYKQSRQWRARVDSWWMETRAAHCGDKVDLKPSERFQMLASELLLHWIHRFLFAHYLKRFAQEAIGVERLTGTSSLQDAEQFFATLSSKRDYAQVFRTRPGAEIIPKAAWQTLTTFNGFLNTIHLPTIDQDLLQESLQSVTRASQRKLAGQFCTPIPLARLLVSLAVDDLEKALVPVKDHFTIARGERRGWDALFYPPEGSGIEPEYLQPVLKTSASVKRLDAKPDAHAFCCSATIDELQNLGHHGAMAWIKRFEQAVNEKGRPLSTVLKQPGKLWYEMRPDAVADLAISINPGNRLFFIRLTPRAFTNQRLTRLVANATTDVDLCHALLCSLTGCLYLEAIGFGRGLGALDLSASRLRNNLWMLDPARIAPSDRTRILTAFSTLKNRDVMDFEDEVMRTDRQTFETTVLEAFGLNAWKDQIQKTALDLHRIRNAANLHSREKET
ncbi:MAG: hypothetical protein ACOX5G_13465 [Kiritimatiellia bacterium]|jgi:hypothetical protein